MFSKGFDHTTPPVLENIDFCWWKARMESFIQSTSLKMWDIFESDQPAEIPSAEPVSPSAPAPNLSKELCMKYGFKRPETPVVAITKLIHPSVPTPIHPISISKTQDCTSSEQFFKS